MVSSESPFGVIRDLYEEGQYLSAWEAARDEGPLETWPLIEPRILAGRLAMRLGAPRRSRLLHQRIFRRHRDHPGAQYYYIFHVLERAGTVAAWQERRRLGPPPPGDAVATADYHGQCAQLLGTLRDFPAAEQHLELGLRAAPERPYWFVERAQVCQHEDRYEAALEAAEQGLAKYPRYPPGITSVAHYLQMLDRTDEALDLLRRKAADTQCGDIVGQLIGVLVKLRMLDEAAEAVARYQALMPLMERAAESWLASTRATIATYRGDYQSAAEHLEHATHPYHDAIARNLRAFLADPGRGPPRRVELPVHFVRQHYLTCAPATLSAISGFWRRPAEHLSVAEEICYDGTPNHSERRWAEEHGWIAREFRMDWNSATALIDRGLPFTLTVRDASSGHLQAVIGYDEPTGVLLARDPTNYETLEMNAVGFAEQQRAVGPRGMTMVPREHAGLLAGVDLPEADLYDLQHEMQLALDAHDRGRAVDLLARMAATAPGHRLTLAARSVLASYDSNHHETRAVTEALLDLFPDDPALQLARLRSLREVAGRDERLGWLADICRRPEADPLLLIEHAVELGADDRQLEQAIWYLRRALRRRWDDPYALYQLASFLWRVDRKDEATDLFRFAASLDDPREAYSQRYFEVCRLQGQADAGLAFLRSRVARLGARSGAPAMTLFGALEALDRTDEAFALLNDALASRPEDGELRLFAAGKCAHYGRADEARAHRAAAAGRVKHVAWLAETAREARLQGDRDRALADCREILRIRPLDLEAHGTVALLLSETATHADAVAHLQAACAAFPHHAELHHLLYRWTAGDPAVAREQVLRTILTIDAADAWTERELALNLLAQGRFPEALETAERAIAIEGASAAGYSIRGTILNILGRSEEAAASFREAIARSADWSDAVHGLLDACGDSVARRKEALEFVEARLLAQAIFGDGLLAFRQAARGVLTPDELLAALRRAHERRPDLWHAWSALSQHLAEMGRTDEALDVARAATERFSMVPRVWLDLSRIHRTRVEIDERVRALQHCRDIAPDWTEPILELCDAYEQGGRGDEAERVLETSLKRTPLVAELRGRLASLLHRRGEHDRAIETLREALRSDPDYAWGWRTLTEWSTDALDLARGLAESRPGESQPWVRLADLALGAARPEVALEAADRALQANPRDTGGHDVRAMALVSLRRFREAEDACTPAAWREHTPLELLGRAAWVDAQRGDLTGAIGRMQALLDANPDYRWGWHQLVEWAANQGLVDQAIRAAERLAWLDPANVVPLGWLGDLKQRQGDTRGAQAAFERAMRLEPSYLFAGYRYFDMQCAAGEFDAARRTLDILRPFAPREKILSAQVRLAVARREMESALKLMQELCANPAFEAQALWDAAGAILDARWSRRLERLLTEVLEGPAWHPATPALWIRARAARGRYGSIRRYRWLRGLGAAGKDAVNEVLGVLGARVAGADGQSLLFRLRFEWHLFWIRTLCRGWRSEDDLYWGKMSYALLSRGTPGAVIRWMRDWRERRNAESWMLQNLTVALLHRRRDEEAKAVLRHVARHRTRVEHVNSIVRLWCVVGACLEDDLDLADQVLHETPADAVAVGERPLRDFGVMLLAVLRAPGGAAALTREARAKIDYAAQETAASGATRRLLKLARLKIARHAQDRWMTMTAWAGVHLGTPSGAALIFLGILLLSLLAR